jgi:ankyrin repeat protein
VVLVLTFLFPWPELVAYYLSRQASVHTHDISGYTPVHAAAYMGHPEVLRTLIQANGNPKPTFKGQIYSPMYWAVTSNRRSCAEVMFFRCSPPPSLSPFPLFLSFFALKVLMQHGVKLAECHGLASPPEWAQELEFALTTRRHLCRQACIALLGCRGRTTLASRDIMWLLARVLWTYRNQTQWDIPSVLGGACEVERSIGALYLEDERDDQEDGDDQGFRDD